MTTTPDERHTLPVVTYGPGGFDPTRPDHNIVEIGEIDLETGDEYFTDDSDTIVELVTWRQAITPPDA